jgi:hypothetical protein
MLKADLQGVQQAGLQPMQHECVISWAATPNTCCVRMLSDTAKMQIHLPGQHTCNHCAANDQRHTQNSGLRIYAHLG